MGAYFLDSSAIVKRYVFEQGRSFILALYNPAQHHNLYISQIALVEVVASMCRRTREDSITIADRDTLIEAFNRHCRKIYSIQRITTTVVTSAGNLCRLHKLRAYDAVQLACALQLRDKALASKTSVPIFVCADNNLINIAATEGLKIENPNNYP